MLLFSFICFATNDQSLIESNMMAATNFGVLFGCMIYEKQT